MNEIVIHPDYLREVIKGTIQFRKCPLCDADGIELQAYDEDGEPCDAGKEGAHRSDCESCDGVAFIEIPS